MRILVFDDARQHYWEPLKTVAAAVGFDVPDKQPGLRETLDILEDRRVKARGKGHADSKKEDIDDAAIVVIDYDLAFLKNSGFVTGENFAYLARCYSQCDLIIGLNQFLEVDFDLTLRGHLESFADLNVNDTWLASDGLWQENWNGFRPWHWPLVPLAVKNFKKRVAVLEAGALDERVSDVLGLTDVANRIPRTAAQFLSQRKNALDVRVRDFVLHSGNGLRHKDKQRNDANLARIAAARLSKWLERLILPAQDVLVDAPHLVSRFPSLLRTRGKVEDCNKTAKFEPASALNVQNSRIERHRYKAKHWLSREAWMWPGISMDESSVEELKNPWALDANPYVFAEDYSCFCEREQAREFVADLPSVFVRRFVRNEPSIKYGPQIRFAI